MAIWEGLERPKGGPTLGDCGYETSRASLLVLPERSQSAAGVKGAETGVPEQGFELLKKERKIRRGTEREGQRQGWDWVGRVGTTGRLGEMNGAWRGGRAGSHGQCRNAVGGTLTRC